MQQFPPALPYHSTRDDLAVPQLGTPPLMTDMNAGNKRRRKIGSAQRTEMTVAWIFTGAQFKTFEAFLRTTLQNGSLRFTMPVWDGEAYVTRTCSFNQVSSPGRLGMEMVVSAQLEIEDWQQ